MENEEERNILTLQEFCELLRNFEDNYGEVRNMLTLQGIRALSLNTRIEEKEDISLESNNEEEEIARESNEVENVTVLQCSHAFHSRCIGMWVAHKSSCPLCSL
ncbi:hypothetical protein AMTRI_Chr06g176990 [Amborella trichopoda]